MEIQPDIYHIKGKGSNFYLCAEPDALLLVDVGVAGDYRKLFETIEKLGRDLSALKHILITHADFDHAGSLAEIVARTGAQVYASRETAVFLQQGKSPSRDSWLAQIILASLGRYTPISANAIQIVEDGDRLPFLSMAFRSLPVQDTRSAMFLFTTAQRVFYLSEMRFRYETAVSSLPQHCLPQIK